MGCTGHIHFSGWVSDLSQGLPLRRMKEEMAGSVSLYLWFPSKEEVYPVGLRTFWKVGRQKAPLLTFLIGWRLLHSSLYLLEDRRVAMLGHWLSLQGLRFGSFFS